MGRARRDRSVQCWPNGHAGGPCEHSIPNTDPETMERYGWGFVLAPDAGMPGYALGHFYACPLHRDDIDEERRASALLRFREVIGKEETNGQ